MKLLPTRRFIRSLSRRFHLEKRERFGIVVLILSFFLIFTQTIFTEYRFLAVILFTLVTYPLAVWGIQEDIKKAEWLTLFILPVLFSLSVSLFYFLLPVRWLTRLPSVVLYAIGMYAILLSENIYNVAANRSIQLLRAAQSVGFLTSLVILFLFINIIASFHLPIVYTALMLSGVAFFLYLSAFWAVTLAETISKKLILSAIVCALSLGELVITFSFWPIRTTLMALFISSVFYSSAGIIQEYLLERLFKGVVRDYLWVTIIVFLLITLVTQWG